MERHHFDRCLAILNADGMIGQNSNTASACLLVLVYRSHAGGSDHNILVNTDTKEYMVLLKLIEQAIMATDLANCLKIRPTYMVWHTSIMLPVHARRNCCLDGWLYVW